MKVKDLISKLNGFDDDMEVVIKSKKWLYTIGKIKNQYYTIYRST
jgi:hypothetical protein